MNKEILLKELGSFKYEIPMTTKFGGYSKDNIIMTFENGTIFKSYESIIAIKLKNKIYTQTFIGAHYNYSNTTNFYRCQYLGENIKETRKNIKSGNYIYLESLR